MSKIEVRGYSERGMINALCYEMMYSADSVKLLQDFLLLITFPFSKPEFTNIQRAKIIIEQSFSDFGDLDLLILIEGEQAHAILLEAKVKTYQANTWLISSEWSKFKQLSESNSTSNLFIQLYRKMRLIRKVKDINRELGDDILSSRWSLGENTIVKKAAQELSHYCSNSWFVALIPDTKENLEQFVKNKLQSPPQNLPDWDSSKFGYLTWAELEKYCKSHPNLWQQTIANFDYNEGQIFGEASQNGGTSDIPNQDTFVLWESILGKQIVKIKRRGPKNSRIILRDRTEKVVPNSELKDIPPDFPVDWDEVMEDFRPLPNPITEPGTQMIWNSPKGKVIVTIKRRGEDNTRVILPDKSEKVVPNDELSKN